MGNNCLQPPASRDSPPLAEGKSLPFLSTWKNKINICRSAHKKAMGFREGKLNALCSSSRLLPPPNTEIQTQLHVTGAARASFHPLQTQPLGHRNPFFPPETLYQASQYRTPCLLLNYHSITVGRARSVFTEREMKLH